MSAAAAASSDEHRQRVATQKVSNINSKRGRALFVLDGNNLPSTLRFSGSNISSTQTQAVAARRREHHNFSSRALVFAAVAAARFSVFES